MRFFWAGETRANTVASSTTCCKAASVIRSISLSQNYAGRIDADLFANMAGDEFVITGHYFELNAILPKRGDGSRCIRPGRIGECQIACQHQR